MKNLNSKLQEKIHNENIKPINKKIFVMQNLIMWGFWIVAILIGGAFISGVLFKIFNTPFEYAAYLNTNGLVLFITSIPLYWILFIAISIFLSYIQLRTTDGGYKYNGWVIIVLNIFFSFVLGVLLYFVGVGQITDSFIERGLLQRHTHIERQEIIWNNPDSGRLQGLVVDADQDNILLIDRDSIIWTIELDPIIEATLPFPIEKLDNQPIRIIGQKQGEDDFYACSIIPNHIRGGELRRILNSDEIKLNFERSNICRDINP